MLQLSRDDTDITQEIRARCPPRGSALPGTATVGTGHPQTPGDLQVGSGTKPKGCCPAAAAPAWPQGRTSPGLGSQGLRLLIPGAHGTSCEMLRPSSSALHQPIQAAQVPSLRTSTFQPTPTSTGLCWSSKPSPPCPVPTKYLCQGDLALLALSQARGSCPPLPCALRAAVSSLGHQQILHRNVSPACLLQKSVSGGLTRILSVNGQKPLAIHRAQGLVL